ncbi:MAG: hypothetical protein L0287_23575 [Anaerolineae bacterium]|nr:hypothetical protein [Anaerolineae bacterium]
MHSSRKVLIAGFLFGPLFVLLLVSLLYWVQLQNVPPPHYHFPPPSWIGTFQEVYLFPFKVFLPDSVLAKEVVRPALRYLLAIPGIAFFACYGALIWKRKDTKGAYAFLWCMLICNVLVVVRVILGILVAGQAKG